MFYFSLDSTPAPARTLARLVAGQLSPDAVPEEQWAELIPLALDHGLGGMLIWSLRKGGWKQDGDPRWQPLVTATQRDGRRSLLLERARRQAAAALDGAEVPAIWLKGATLAHTHYPEPHLRPMDDLDVLVPPDRLAAARQALLEQGFRPAESDFFELAGFTGQARHHEGLIDRTGQVRLELHFRLLAPTAYSPWDAEALDWFWKETEKVGSVKELATPATSPTSTTSVVIAPESSFLGLKPEPNLLYLCAHAILQSHGERLDLLHLLDLHLLLSQSPLDWDLVVRRAAALRWTYAVEYALGLLPDLFGTRLPEGLLAELQAHRLADELPPARLGSHGGVRRWEEWRQAYDRMSAPQRLRLVWQTLFPPEQFLRRQYGLRQGESLLRYYGVHFLDGGREVVRALRRGSPGSKRSQGNQREILRRQ